MIVGEQFKNILKDGKVIGYQFGLRIPYFSSVVLSLISPMELKVDGEIIPEEQMTLTLDGKTYPKNQLRDDPITRWEFGRIGIISVLKPGGLTPGEHNIDVRQGVMIGFQSGGMYGHDIKTLTVK